MDLRKHHYEAYGSDGIPVKILQILKNDAVKVLHSICQQIWKTQQWLQDWKRSVFIPTPKNGKAKECSNYHTIVLISHARKVILKIPQSRLQQYVNHELPKMFKLVLEKAEEPEIKLPASIESKKNQQNLRKFSALLIMPKPLTVWITTNCGKLLEMGIPDHLTCLVRNLYAGQEAAVRTEHGTTDWFKIGKGVCQGCILSPCLFNLYAENFMRNAGLEETQAGIKIAGRNINNLRYADDTTLMAESERN